jgi:hypothetical protein
LENCCVEILNAPYSNRQINLVDCFSRIFGVIASREIKHPLLKPLVGFVLSVEGIRVSEPGEVNFQLA